MSFEDYLEHAAVEDTIAEILKGIHPVLEKKREQDEKDAQEFLNDYAEFY